MTPYERTINRLRGEKVDKIPNFSIVMQFAAEHAGVAYSRFCLDYRSLVRCNIRCCEDFGLDILSTMSDAYREAYDYGAQVDFVYDNLPKNKGHFIEGAEDFHKLKRFAPKDSIRIADRIRAVELYKKECGNEYPIMGWVEGAFAEYNDLRGMNGAMLDLYDEPEFIHDCMALLTEQGIACALEQVKAGAHIIGVGDAAASQVSPELYSEFILPYEKRLFKAINDSGAISRLHICGNITHLLDGIAEIGASIVDADWMVDFRAAHERLDGISCVCGNFDPVEVLYNGTPEDVRAATQNCVAMGDDKTFIMPGCEVPKGTRYENFKAIDEALRDLNTMN